MNSQFIKILLPLLFQLILAPLFGQPEDSLTIQSVTIIRDDAFSDTSKTIYKTANDLHPITKEQIIRRQILFSEGERVDMELVKETERILRGLPFLETASIHLDTTDEGVDIEIHTFDVWSLLLIADLGTGGGLTTIGLGIEEYNFLGYGKHLMIYNEWQSDIGSTWDFIYEDPQLFGTKWEAFASYKTGEVNNDFVFNIGLPYFSSDSKWDFEASYVHLDQIERLFSGGMETSRQVFKEKAYEFDLERRFGKRYKKFSFGIGFDHTDRRFSDIDGQTNTPLPNDELLNRLSAIFTKENIKFAEDIRIQKMGIKEDIILGPVFAAGIARAGVFGLKGVKRWEYFTYYNHDFKFGKKSYLSLSAGYTTKQTRDEIYSASIQYYSRVTSSQTLALNLQASYSDNLQAGSQFLLGGESGLRGYPARFVGGDVLFLSNIEDRIFTGLQLAGMEFGGVVFFDAGYVWKKDAPILFKDLLASAGIGLRACLFSFPEASVISLDYGIPLDGRRPIISMGFGQQF